MERKKKEKVKENGTEQFKLLSKTLNNKEVKMKSFDEYEIFQDFSM